MGEDKEPGGQAAGVKKRRTDRLNMRIHPDQHERLDYWADRYGISKSEYMAEALDQKIAWENKDYPLPTLEQHRLNQLIGEIASLVSTVNSLQQMVSAGFDTIQTLTRGDSPLLDDDDGELGTDPGAPGEGL